jgi:hypothetical protein
MFRKPVAILTTLGLIACFLTPPKGLSETELVSTEHKITIPWQTQNFALSAVPDDFNRQHHLVGTPKVKLHSANGFSVGKSLYLPIPTGPYRDKSLLEIQFKDDKDHTVARFRFVEKQNTKITPGTYSTWQKNDFGVPHNINDDTNMPAELTYFSAQCFDPKIWRANIGLRRYQTWDLLHFVPIIGIRRKQIIDLLGTESEAPHQKLDNVSYYELGLRSDNLPSPMVYLELKYNNDRVVAFQTETLKEIWRDR